MLYGLFTQPDHSLDRGSLQLRAVVQATAKSVAEENLATLTLVLTKLYAGDGVSFFFDRADELKKDQEAIEREYYGWDFDPSLKSYPLQLLEGLDPEEILTFIDGDLTDELGKPTREEVEAALEAVRQDREAEAAAAARRQHFKAGQAIFHLRQRGSHAAVGPYKAHGHETSDSHILASDVSEADGRAAVEVFPYPQSINRTTRKKDRMMYWGRLKADPSVEYFGKTQKEIHLKAAAELAAEKRA